MCIILPPSFAIDSAALPVLQLQFPDLLPLRLLLLLLLVMLLLMMVMLAVDVCTTGQVWSRPVLLLLLLLCCC
jgi:hypothetical protein